MKRVLVFILGFILPFLFVSNVYAQEDERILGFDSDITVNRDTTINIKEKIVFSPSISTPRHGLEWQIPYVYSFHLFRRNTQLTIDEVVYYPLNSPNEKIYNEYSRTDENGWAILRIGNEDTYIQGTYVYEIDYTLKYSGISYFDENDEVYLNIIGPGWRIPIENASARIVFPSKPLDFVCYTGSEGSTEQNCIVNQDDNVINVSPSASLNSYEGCTIAAKLEKGVLEDTRDEQRISFIIGNIGILIPIPVGIFLFGFLGRKFKNKKLTVIPQYEPEKDMDVLLSGILYTNTLDPKYITATIIELATKGYLKIREYDKKKYELIKREKDISNLSEHLRMLYNALFENGDAVAVDKLANFQSKSSKVYLNSYQYLKDTGILSIDKITRKNIYTVICIVILIMSFASFAYFVPISSIGTPLGVLVSSILGFIFISTIGIRSEKGNKKYHYLKGLKLYIETAEKHRIEFHNDPKRYNEVFEKLLPYAMIFGLEKKWAKLFEDIYTTTPTWYEGDFTVFNAYLLTNSLGGFNTTFAKNITPPYDSKGGFRSGGWSSGGSGFSGGSVGGGGGGSGGGGW